MLKDIVEAKALPNHRLWVKFDDGVEGELDFASLTKFRGVFAPLSSQKEFEKVSVNAELGVVCWPNGADLDTEVLYSLVTGKPITLNDGTVVPFNHDPTHA